MPKIYPYTQKWKFILIKIIEKLNKKKFIFVTHSITTREWEAENTFLQKSSVTEVNIFSQNENNNSYCNIKIFNANIYHWYEADNIEKGCLSTQPKMKVYFDKNYWNNSRWEKEYVYSS